MSFLHQQQDLCVDLEILLTKQISYIQSHVKVPAERGGMLLDLHQARIAWRRQSRTIAHAISPIQWLPPELLSEIFYHCLPNDYHFSRRVAPLLFCLVCRSWRALALSVCGLWRKISFWPLPPSKRDLLCYPTRLVNQWLSHSGSLPLQICFDHGMSLNHIKTYVELVLLEYYPRIQHLELSVSRESAPGLHNFINLPSGSLTSLESLVLENLDEADFIFPDDEDDVAEDIPFPITVFDSSHQLRKLTTSFLEYTHHLTVAGAVFHSSVLPWPKLTYLTITEFVYVDIFAAVLAECVAIQFLRVSLNMTPGEQRHPSTTLTGPLAKVVLPNLTAMFISLDGGLTFPAEMDTFILPALVDAHIRRYQDDEVVVDHFSWMRSAHFCKQSCHLRQLTLTGHVGSGEQVIALLRGMPNLIKLSLDIFVDYQTLLPVLFPPNTTSLPSNTTSPIHRVKSLEVHAERGELTFPRGPPHATLRDMQGRSRMRHITNDLLQPTLFRFRELIESAHTDLDTLHVFILETPGPTYTRILRELRMQFFSSALHVQFESKNDSLRDNSDQGLIEDHGMSYTLY